MVRNVFAVVGGAIAWMAAFMLATRLLYLLWEDYARHAQEYVGTGTYDFTPLMSGFNALSWVVAEILAGCIALAIARRREPAWVLAALLTVYLGFMHLYYMWESFPWWYNLAVVVPALPAVLLGSRAAQWLHSRRVRT